MVFLFSLAVKSEKLTPFGDRFGDSIGRGKDNIVVPFRTAKDRVVKWNHDSENPLSSDEHFWRLLYKKKKYEMLKLFLGDFIPDSWFVLGNKQDGRKVKTKEYIIQTRIPQFSISTLTGEQKQDPRLLQNLRLLFQKLQYMYVLLEKVNHQVDECAKLDGKLDLGGLSKYAEEFMDCLTEGVDLSKVNYNFMSSPNLLVDQETMDVFCVDFDHGVWSKDKEKSLCLVKMILDNQSKLVTVAESTIPVPR